MCRDGAGREEWAGWSGGHVEDFEGDRGMVIRMKMDEVRQGGGCCHIPSLYPNIDILNLDRFFLSADFAVAEGPEATRGP